MKTGYLKGCSLACVEPLSDYFRVWMGTRFGPFDVLGAALILATVALLMLGKSAEMAPRIE